MNAHTNIEAVDNKAVPLSKDTQNDLPDDYAMMHRANRSQFESLVRGTVEIARTGQNVSEDIAVILEAYNAMSRSCERMMGVIRKAGL